MSKLNDRQIALFEYIKERGDQWTLQEQIAKDLCGWYPYKRPFHDSYARSIMTKDIQAINGNQDVQKIIISSPQGIKLSNEQEFAAYIKRQYSSVFRRLKRIRQKERKATMHGQSYWMYETEQDIVNAFLNEG